MAPSSFTENLIYSSQGRLPGSNTNESHHVMPGLFLSTDHTNQNNQVNQTTVPSQETQRSVVGQQPHDYQGLQSSTIDTTKADNFTQPKKQQQQEEHEQLDYDPDPATRSAFQNLSKPTPTRRETADSEERSSATGSLDSNRAIIDQPFVSGQPSSTTPNETMPATYRQNPQRDQGAELNKPGMQGNHANSHAGATGMNQQDIHQNQGPLQATPAHGRGPLDTTDVTNQQYNPSSPPNNGTPGQPQDFDYSRRRSSLHKRRGSTPDSECMAALPVMQSYVPYAQGVAIMSNHEARYEDDQQHAAATNRRYSLHGADEPSQPPERRRSSLTETIVKVFHRRGSK